MTEFIFKAQKNENTKNIPGEISLAESDLNKDTYNDSELFPLVASLQMEIYAPSYYVSGTEKALVLVDEGYKKFFSNEYDVDEKVEKIEIQELQRK